MFSPCFSPEECTRKVSQDEHKGDHHSSQQSPHRLRKSIIDGSDLIAPRDGAAVRLASSSRAVRCRRLPIAYRLLVARSDVAAAKQAWSQSPRGSPRRSRWAGPLGRLNKGQELCFPILLKQHFCRKLFFCGRRLALFGVNCGASRRIHLPSPARPPGAAYRLPAHRPPRPLGGAGHLWVRAKSAFF